MPGDRLLGTLLRSLQSYTDQQDTPRLLGSASSLLTTLNNPLNVTLLTSQLLSAPAIWYRPDGLQTVRRELDVFRAASVALLKHEDALKERSADEDFAQLQFERTLPKNEWTKAVIGGADQHSSRWRHLLALGGLLLGFGPADSENLSRSMRSTLENALVNAANHALAETPADDELGMQSIAFVLNHSFPLLPDHERSRLDFDTLLPCLMRATFHSESGFRSGYFLGALDQDVRPVSDSQFGWSTRSSSFRQVESMLSDPLLSGLGPLCRLIGHAIENVNHSSLVLDALSDVEMFSRTLNMQWRQNKLSEVDSSEYQIYLNDEARNRTTPQLWRLFTTTMFGVFIVLRSIVSRTLNDSLLASAEHAPAIAIQALQTLRSLYFISARTGSSSFSQYAFVHLTAIDILGAYPASAESFIQLIKPADHTAIPLHPLDRNLDLFFFNTVETFTLILSPRLNEELLISCASPYLAAGGNNNLLPIFEAAHSVMLAIFSAPQNAEVTARHLPFYIEALFTCFPNNLSARQFRMAFKTLLRIASPPAILATTEPLLSATLLELLHARQKLATTNPIFPYPENELPDSSGPAQLSEQAVVTLTIIDTLVELPLDLLHEWLPLSVNLIHDIQDGAMREYCKEQFWQTLVGGGMDPDRSELCQAWWSTEGGREMLLFGPSRSTEEQLVMSGALPDEARDNKL